MAIEQLTLFGPAPNRNDPDTFRQRGDNTMASIVAFVPEMNDVIVGINVAQTEVVTAKTMAVDAASAAAASATAAGVSAAASLFNSGQTYAIGAVSISRINFQAYRKRTTATGSVIDPFNDTTNWRIVASGSNTFVPVAVAASSIDLRLGSYFTKTISANTTLSIDNCPPDGVSFTLELTVTSGSVTFAQASAIKTSYDRPIVLAAGKTHELMFVTSNGGARWKLAVGESFTT